jgi:hypothetical protein
MPSIQEPILDKIRFDKLKQLAEERYGQLSDAETNVLRNSTSSSYPPHGTPGSKSSIAPDFLRWVIVDPYAASLIDPKGLRVYQANIDGPLDLDGCHVSFSMEFRDCNFEKTFSIKNAQVESLSIRDSMLKAGINGELSTFRGSVSLVHIDSCGPLALEGAQIAGDFKCSGKTSARYKGEGLVLDRITVQGGVFLEDIRCRGAVRIRGAQVAGNLTFFRTQVDARGQAISLDRSTIKGSVLMNQNFTCLGAIGMFDVSVGGDLELEGANLNLGHVDPKAPHTTLALDRATIHGSIDMTKYFKTNGTVSMFATHVGGDLNCQDANFEFTGPTLHLDRATIQGTVNLSGNFQASGQIQMFNTQIGDKLDCSGAHLAGNPECLVLYGATIKGDVLMTPNAMGANTKCVGRVQMYGAQISGNVDCTSAEFKAPPAEGTTMANANQISVLGMEKAYVTGNIILNHAQCAGRVILAGAMINNDIDCQRTIIRGSEHGQSLSLENATVNGNVLLHDGFQASAVVKASNAQIRGGLYCMNASFTSLQCDKMKLTGDLTLVGIQPPGYCLDIRDASVKFLHDQSSSWPEKNSLRLEGFVYQDLVLHGSATPTSIKDDSLPEAVLLDANTRISWLRLQPPAYQTNPQPWVQLASLLESKGDPAGAKQVRFEFSRVQAKSTRPLHSFLSLIYDWIEKDPINVLWPIVLLWLFGSLVFWRARRMNAMAPVDKDAFEKFKQSQPLPDQIAPFSPTIYTLENVLPVVKLGQDASWAPSPLRKPTSWFPHRKHMEWTRWLPGLNYPWLALLRWTLILLGWALALILGAAIGSRFK